MRIFITLTLIMTCSFVFGQDVEAVFQQANALSKEGNTEGAISKYKSVETSGMMSVDLYYNLGTSYLKSNDVPNAVLYLEKAHKADPSNANIKHNLEVARSQIDSEIIEVPDFILLRLWRGVCKVFSPLLWFIFQIVLGMVLIYGIYNWKLGDTGAQKFKGFVVTVSSMMLLLFCISAGFTADKMANNSSTAILMKSVDLKSGADDRSETLTNLSEGVKLRINDQIGDWYKVQLINKEEGWIKVEDVSLI